MMPIDDERRRIGRTKGTAQAKPQAIVATEGELDSKVRVQESLQRLLDISISQRGEQAEVLAEEEERVEANKRAAQRARNERDERYERMQQAFERAKKRQDEEEAARAADQERSQGDH